MIDQQIFNPRDLTYKTPYGAVPSGTTLTLRVRPKRNQCYAKATLTLRFEGRSDEEQTLPMEWEGIEGDCDVFAVQCTVGDYVGLIWYSFALTTLKAEVLELKDYQLTVYEDEVVPTWFGEGVSYQIFPDRFHRLSIPDPTGMVGGRTVHQSWTEEPQFRPDAKGEIRNRDFFGGSLAGVMEKLPYLHDLGVETIYFCPIFEAAENHRYGTADYDHIDPMLGDLTDFTALCDEAHRLGMKIMLDGVFNHTGFVSRYFNGDGFYPTQGAKQSTDSPYYPWFAFQQWPDKYDSWWGIYSLPAVNEENEAYRNFIFGDENSVVRRWLRAGADGWRLDVADEIPDDFVSGIHRAVRAEKPHGLVIGEVWEDGSSKIAYGVRRKHILGGHCDGLMNYPFRNAAISYLMGGDAAHFMGDMEKLRENYPPFAHHSAMNALGTHDTARILTLLGAEEGSHGWNKEERAAYRLAPEGRKVALERLKLGVMLLMAFPGSPTIYYGDEVGMEGFEDPFNRRTFPWGQEDWDIHHWYAKMAKARKEMKPLRLGDITYLKAEGSVLAFTRSYEGETVLCALNAGNQEVELSLPWAEEPMVLPPMAGRLEAITPSTESLPE